MDTRDYLLGFALVWIFATWISLVLLQDEIDKFESRVQKIEQLVPISFKIER